MGFQNTVTLDNLQTWESTFRAAAKADEYVLLRNHLRRLNFPDKPKLLMEGTVQVVRACWIYANIDARPFSRFLRMQHYDPSTVVDARYVFTFDLCGKAFARILISPKDLYGKNCTLDLADLYGHPWHDYKICGYSSLWISRNDGMGLKTKERNYLEQVVTGDLRFDYSEDELDLWFDDSTVEGTLRVEFLDKVD